MSADLSGWVAATVLTADGELGVVYDVWLESEADIELIMLQVALCTEIVTVPADDVERVETVAPSGDDAVLKGGNGLGLWQLIGETTTPRS